jgi:hypothetical protein
MTGPKSPRLVAELNIEACISFWNLIKAMKQPRRGPLPMTGVEVEDTLAIGVVVLCRSE